MMREVAQKIETHDREMMIYTVLFPILNRIRLDARTVSADPIHLRVAQMYYCATGGSDDKVIVMEDIKHQGFQSADRTKGCDVHPPLFH